jgi:hypothetical protein
LAFGASAAAAVLIYELQRSSLLVPHSLDRAVQAHLDALGITAFALALSGTLIGAYLGRGRRQTPVLLWGTVLSVAALLAQLLLPL